MHWKINAFRRDRNPAEQVTLRNNPKILDFNEWVSDRFGNRILETESISTSNSIELVFSLASVGAILGFQHISEIKDIVIYAEGALRNWLGMNGNSCNSDVKGRNIKIPSLPLSMERTISKFDNVELSQSNEGWTIKLKRKP
jgi:hypothetical protein